MRSWLFFITSCCFFVFGMIINNYWSFIITCSPLFHLNTWLLHTKIVTSLELSQSFGADYYMLPSFDNVCSELKLYFSDLTTALVNVWVPVFDLTSYILSNISVTKSKPAPAKECKF